MGISFSNPWWWLLIPPVLLAAWYLRLPWLKMARRLGGPPWRKEIRRLAVRICLFLLLGAALAGTHLVAVIQRQAVVFALDASASVGAAKGQGEDWIRAALAKKPPDGLAGVISFGERALVEEPPEQAPSFVRTGTEPGGGASRIGEALNLAQALLPAEARKRVVLLSDGRDTQGEAVTAARQLHAQGVRVDVVKLGEKAGPDLRLESVKLPPRARVGETFSLEVVAFAGSEGAGTLFLERDGKLLAAAPVNFQAGENRYSVPVEAGSGGLHSYRAYLVAGDGQKDAFAANNEAGAAQEVTGPPRVLVVASRPAEAEALVRSLKATGEIEIDLVDPGQVPRGLPAWARYQAVFLVDVPAYSLGEKAMAEIEAYVRDGGGGLVMTGGPDSFGPGGYTGTPVERALPVKMDISGRGELPSLGLVLVIDKSGSMAEYAGGADKINLAKEAAARSVTVLTDRDQVGVIAFDTLPWWVVPLGPAQDKESIRKEIGRIYADGGTEIYPSLAAAYAALKQAPTQVKHIILLTDGISASGGPYQKLLEEMRGAGITLTCVAVGEGADTGMLRALAELGRGRYYATAEAGSIPSIFTKETVMATRSFAVNERFVPGVAAPSVLLQGIRKAPALDGYVAASPKDRAEVALVSHRGDPVLAAWQYGLGRAVAWTPDAAGRWSAAWAAGQLFPRLWGNVLSWILPAVNTGSVQVATTVEESGDVRIVVDDPAHWQQVGNYSLRITGPAGETKDVALTPAGPGRYTARITAPGTGASLISVMSSGDAGQVLIGRSALVIPYPAEYKETGADLARLEEIARAGGGEVLVYPEQAFAPNLRPVRASRDLTGLLLILAGLCWLLDVAGRRLSFGTEEREALKRSWAQVRAHLAFRQARARREADPSPSWAGQTLARVENLRIQKRGRGGAASGGLAGAAGSGPVKAAGPAPAEGTGKGTGTFPAVREEAGKKDLFSDPGSREPVSPENRLPGRPDGKAGEDTAATLLAAKRRRKEEQGSGKKNQVK
ncbi:MAG: VWA domain-containing protein [Bacillota bacterium]